MRTMDPDKKKFENHRYYRALMILAVEGAKQQELVDQQAIWSEQRLGRGTVLEINIAKIV